MLLKMQRLLLLVVAVMLGSAWAVSCPQVCSCRYHFDLLSANCTSLPYNGGKVEALTLLPPRDTRVELRNGQFNYAKHLKYLTLKNCSIYFIHNKSFYGAKSILEIDLSFNYIEDLDPTVFQHLNNLNTLSLRGNPIHLEEEVPFLISNSLSHLDIGQCNITNIPLGIFYELKKLKYLSLDGNLLITLEYNSLPKGLKYLDISNNLIVNLPTEVISTLTNLRRLNIAGNPINCSCTLMNMQDWLSGQAVIFENDVICASPPIYKGVSWSKVNENELCLVEARQEETSYSSSESMENQLSHQKDRYWEERVQSDQPGGDPDSQYEVFMKNDDTIAMGEMMRDEEEITSEREDLAENKDSTLEKDYVFSETEEKQNVEVTDDIQNANNQSSDNEANDNAEEVTVGRVTDDKNENSEIHDLNAKSANAENENSAQEETVTKPDQNNDFSSESVNTEYLMTNNEAEEVVASTTQSAPIHDKPVEFETLNEDESEVDEFKKEGLFHVTGEKYIVDPTIKVEESTVNPEYDTTTEEASGQGPLIGEEEEDKGNLSVSSTTEENIVGENDTDVSETVSPPVTVPDLLAGLQNQPLSESTTVETRVTESELNNESHQSTSEPPYYPEENSPIITPSAPEIGQPQPEIPATDLPNTLGPDRSIVNEVLEDSETQSTQKLNKNSNEEKIREMAGAEVVMFCIAILLVCLILYAVYKCRGTKNRQGNMKDLEANRGTEMQDMASLLPKPQEEKKSNSKYDDKAPSSETVKLLTDEKENESPNFIPVIDTTDKGAEEKNSLNNNTSNNKVPQSKPEKPVIGSSPPIERTKVKVGILPDSIPKTPIFLQKTHNGTNKV